MGGELWHGAVRMRTFLHRDEGPFPLNPQISLSGVTLRARE